MVVRLKIALSLWFALWLATGCAATSKATPTPKARTFVTFQQAYDKAQRAALAWDENSVIISSRASYRVYGSPEGTTVMLHQDGTSALWRFRTQSPTRFTSIQVVNGQNVGVGIAEKGEMVCVGGDLSPLWIVAHEIGCESQRDAYFDIARATAVACVQAAVDRGEIVCDDPISVDRLRQIALPVDELIDSDAAVKIARQHGFADWELTGVGLGGSNWTLKFESQVQEQQETRYVEINAMTGEVQSVDS